MIRVALVDPDPQFAEEIEEALGDRNDIVLSAAAFDLNRALALAEGGQVEVMVVGPGISTDISIPFIKKLTTEHPIGVILLASHCTQRLRAMALRANVVDVLEVPVARSDMISGITMAADYAEQLAAAPVVRENADRESALITVFSTKGGVGKTVLSTNMAVAIASHTDAKVALVDLDFQFGDVGIALGLTGDKTIVDIVDASPGAAEGLDDALVNHDSGLEVLLAPREPEKADLISPEMTRSIIGALKTRAEIIIVDTPAAFNDHVLTVLDESHEICVLLTMDIMSVKNTKLCMRTLGDLRYAREKLRVVINRIESNVGLRITEIEKALGVSAIAKIPADKAVPLSVNKGLPVVVDAPKLAVSKSITDLALYYAAKHLPDWAEAGMIG